MKICGYQKLINMVIRLFGNINISIKNCFIALQVPKLTDLNLMFAPGSLLFGANFKKVIWG